MTPLSRFVSSVLTRSMCRLPNSANVPRLGLLPSLLLYFAASDTRHTLLVAVNACLSNGMAVGYGRQRMDAVAILRASQ